MRRSRQPNPATPQGPDRQPVKHPGSSNGPNPDPQQAASPEDVRVASGDAASSAARKPAPDALAPGSRKRKPR